MKSPLGYPVAGAGGRAAFTLIELLTVMAIILILAGLIINIAGSAQYNSAKARATSEIQAISAALENYKSDNGAYPTDTSKTEKLDPKATFDPAATTAYANSSEFLFQALTGQQSGANTVTKSYFNFTAQQLHTAADAPTTPTTPNPNTAYNYIIDPFGFSYGYSTYYAAQQATNYAKSPPDTSAITVGYNPTFDLWSTAGYASGGKSTPSVTPPGATTPAAVYSSLWVKNW